MRQVKAGGLIKTNKTGDGRLCEYMVHSKNEVELITPHPDRFTDVPSYKNGEWKKHARFEVCSIWLKVRGFIFTQ